MPGTQDLKPGASDFNRRFMDLIMKVLGQIPRSDEAVSGTPEGRARTLASRAALGAATLSGSLALPPGPLGLVTLLPDLFMIWKIQSQMVADIAAVYGKTATLTREHLIFCLFKHAAGQAVRDLVVRTGQRLLVRRAPLRLVEKVLERVGLSVAQRLAGRTIVRLLPFIGAVGVGAYAYYDTASVARTAIEFFAQGEVS
jgi:hypothetical protein